MTAMAATVTHLLEHQRGDAFWGGFRQHLEKNVSEQQFDSIVGYAKGPDGRIETFGVRDGEFAVRRGNPDRVVMIVLVERAPEKFFPYAAELAGSADLTIGVDWSETIEPIGTWEEITRQNSILAAEFRTMAADTLLPPLALVRAIYNAKTRGVTEGLGLRAALRDALLEDEKIVQEYKSIYGQDLKDLGLELPSN